MKLSPSLVAVKKINSLVPRSQFSDQDLNRVAELILKTEGIINPPVVRRTSLESYDVVDGDFEYYASVRAREIDPRKGEMIGVFILEPENEEAITEQVKALRGKNTDNNDTTLLTTMLKQFDSLPKQVENLTEMVTQLAESFKKIEAFVSQQPSIKPKIEVKDYEILTKKELEALAAELNIKGRTRMKKNELIEAIKKAKEI